MKKAYHVLAFILIGFFVASCEGDEKEKFTLDNIIEIKTSFGDIHLWLLDDTPLHKENFIALADSNFFDSITFHRVINDFVIQGGDPNTKDNNPSNDGLGGTGYTIDAEIDTTIITHKYGAVGAARMGNDSNPERKSNGSQFYIVENMDGTHFLDGEYTVFGMVLSGMEVVETIADQATNSSDRPLENIYMDINIIQNWEFDGEEFELLTNMK